MSGRRPKPDSSVACRASTRSRPSGTEASRAAARLDPATWAVPCPITCTRSMVPLRRSSTTSAGSTSGPSATTGPVAVVDELAPQRLAEADRRLRDLLQQEVGELAAVDVAGGDLRVEQVGLGDGQLRAVVGLTGDPLERARTGAVELDDLAAAGRRVVGVGRRLAVHAEVGVGQLDDAVGLGGHDVAAVEEPDVERLPAPPQREEQLVGMRRRAGRDGHRSLEGGDGVPERAREVDALGEPARHQGGDDLRVRRDLRGEAQAVHGLEVREVVDVAVQHGRHEGSVGPLELLAVERVGVRLGDDPDAGPAGVAEHDRRRGVRGQGEPEEVVVGDRGPQGPRVVTELADLGRCLVDEAEMTFGGAHGEGAEQRIVAPRRDEAGDAGVGEVETVVAHQDREAGRVAASHLEPVERAEGLLDRRADLDGRPRRAGAHKLAHLLGGREAVPLDGPQRVLQVQDRGVDLLEGVVARRPVEVEAHLGGGHPVGDGRADGPGPDRDVPLAHQQGHAVGVPQESVELARARPPPSAPCRRCRRRARDHAGWRRIGRGRPTRPRGDGRPGRARGR